MSTVLDFLKSKIGADTMSTAQHAAFIKNSGDAISSLWAFDVELVLTPESTAARIAGMKPTKLEALQACDGMSVAAVIKKLMADCGEDRDVCRDAVCDLMLAKLVLVTMPANAKETRLDLTAAGREEVFKEMTRSTGKTARDILSEIENLRDR